MLYCRNNRHRRLSCPLEIITTTLGNVLTVLSLYCEKTNKVLSPAKIAKISLPAYIIFQALDFFASRLTFSGFLSFTTP